MKKEQIEALEAILNKDEKYLDGLGKTGTPTPDNKIQVFIAQQLLDIKRLLIEQLKGK